MSDILIDRPELNDLGSYEFGWSDSDAAGASARRGVSPEVVTDISGLKSEPEWMLKNRLKALEIFGRKPMPTWGADLSGIDFDNIKYFVRSTSRTPTRSSASRKLSARASSRASPPSTSPRSSTTRFRKTSRSRA